MDEPTGALQRRLAPPPGRQRGAALWLVLGLLPCLAAVALAGLTAQWHQTLGWQAWRAQALAQHQADNRRAQAQRAQRQARANAGGFTLLELLLVLALVAALSGMLWPAGQRWLQQARRADGHAALLLAAQWLGQASAPRTLPPPLQTSAQGHYRIELRAAPPQWQLHAHPTGSQRSDRCATLTLGYDGQRQATGGTHCW